MDYQRRESNAAVMLEKRRCYLALQNRRKTNTMSTVAVSAWPTFTSHLIGSWRVADRTMAFRFDRPPKWKFTAGQFVDITLLNPSETDAEGSVRGFFARQCAGRRNAHGSNSHERYGRGSLLQADEEFRAGLRAKPRTLGIRCALRLKPTFVL